mmetsp:Transcript_4345/g.16077  ORF Transcript_4345/g.16077 Transcript_4345/m.16077 type:complete len:200 (+) Transcript_4345:479-1078(+)
MAARPLIFSASGRWNRLTQTHQGTTLVSNKPSSVYTAGQSSSAFLCRTSASITPFQSVSPSASTNWERSQVPFTQRTSLHSLLFAFAFLVAASALAVTNRDAAPASLPAAASPSSVPPLSRGPGLRVPCSAATRHTVCFLDLTDCVLRADLEAMDTLPATRAADMVMADMATVACGEGATRECHHCSIQRLFLSRGDFF